MTLQSAPLTTLEPLMDAVQQGITDGGWTLSGMQKTTSRRFEGRWEDQDSRTAYLFFHCDHVPEWVSVEAFLDETSDGLRVNLALVIDGPRLRALEHTAQLLDRLADVVHDTLPRGYRTPVAVRYRMRNPDGESGDADSEIRLKLHFPAVAMDSGASAVTTLARVVVDAFGRALEHPSMNSLVEDD